MIILFAENSHARGLFLAGIFAYADLDFPTPEPNALPLEDSQWGAIRFTPATTLSAYIALSEESLIMRQQWTGALCSMLPVMVIRAAFGAGANGVVLSREYAEMWLANLTAAGDTLREVFAQKSQG